MSKNLIESIANMPMDPVDYVYGMVKQIGNSQTYFLFSPSGLCDNWQEVAYANVKSYRRLEPMKCVQDDTFYPYFRFEFHAPVVFAPPGP